MIQSYRIYCEHRLSSPCSYLSFLVQMSAGPQSRLHRRNLEPTDGYPLRSADSSSWHQTLLLLYLQFPCRDTVSSLEVRAGPRDLNPGASQGSLPILCVCEHWGSKADCVLEGGSALA